jgi:hypothetical protein
MGAAIGFLWGTVSDFGLVLTGWWFVFAVLVAIEDVAERILDKSIPIKWWKRDRRRVVVLLFIVAQAIAYRVERLSCHATGFRYSCRNHRLAPSQETPPRDI